MATDAALAVARARRDLDAASLNPINEVVGADTGRLSYSLALTTTIASMSTRVPAGLYVVTVDQASSGASVKVTCMPTSTTAASLTFGTTGSPMAVFSAACPTTLLRVREGAQFIQALVTTGTATLYFTPVV